VARAAWQSSVYSDELRQVYLSWKENAEKETGPKGPERGEPVGENRPLGQLFSKGK